MVKEIRIYVEGGGGKESKALMRRAFGRFLSEVGSEAWERERGLQVVACGSREAAHEKFQRARTEHPTAFNVLLVDSEAPVTGTARDHLRGWNLDSIMETQVHLMVQAMEAWLIADPDTLARFYGQGFAANAIPRTKNVETIPKDDLVPALKRATRGTTKGEYHKTRHAFDLLAQIDPAKVRSRAPHCERLFQTLLQQLAS
ncbi:MAG: hypothetical protein AVDCRST_MAG68-1297 [uncultured Gemmatimonadetes bacterium]|uniref:DUF4276 family protein n=1 Tax=uncultured Gemmatimonadota bacterium TaxID=203437 RepID=A0A6J4KMV6_9BACT|nr:MAG: hypothetical protein AVDCRST_MAG68-1297 [uncultured Gemmatimonadota bacterium]